MTNEWNDCTCLPGCCCATHDTDTDSRQTDLQTSTVDSRVSGVFEFIQAESQAKSPSNKPPSDHRPLRPLEILRQENLDDSCPCFWHPLLHLIHWQSGVVLLLSSLPHFLPTSRRTGRGASCFVVFKEEMEPKKKTSLTANEALRKEEGGSDGGGVERGHWFLPHPPFSPLAPPLTLQTPTPPSLTHVLRFWFGSLLLPCAI